MKSALAAGSVAWIMVGGLSSSYALAGHELLSMTAVLFFVASGVLTVSWCSQRMASNSSTQSQPSDSQPDTESQQSAGYNDGNKDGQQGSQEDVAE